MITRILFFLFIWFCFSILLHIPVLVVFPELLTQSKTEYLKIVDANILILILTEVCTVASAVAATYTMIILVEKKKLDDFLITFNFKEILTGFVYGALIFLLFVGLTYFLGVVEYSYNGFSILFITNLLLFLMVAMAEELVVRGYFFNKIRERLSDLVSIVLSSLVFGFMHVFNDNFSWIGFVNILLSGMLMNAVLVKSKTISTPVGLHWSWNFVQGSVFGFNVSGHKVSGVFITKTEYSDFLSGGGFGAEGSVLLIPITAAFLLTRLKKIPFQRALRIRTSNND